MSEGLYLRNDGMLECPECGREFDIDDELDDLKVGDACPSDDCPSNCDDEDNDDAYLKENNLCDLADRRDAEDEERRAGL